MSIPRCTGPYSDFSALSNLDSSFPASCCEAYLRVDPSDGILARFLMKFPEHPTLQKAFGIEDLESVDLVVSLFGGVSYVAPDLIFNLVSSGVNYFLMFYKQGSRPATSDMIGMDCEHYAFSKFNLPSQDFGNYTIVTNLRMPCGSLAFPRFARRNRRRAHTLPSSTFQCEKHLPMDGKYMSFQDEPQDDQRVKVKTEKGASLGGTVLTMMNAQLGSGALVLPYAWRLAGWMFAVPFCGIALLLGFTLWLTGFLLKVVDSRAAEMGVPQVNRDWGMLGRMAFGPAGGLFFSTCVFIDLYGCIMSFLIIVRNHMKVLLPACGLALTGIIYALFLLLLFVDTRHFSFVAALGLISMLLAVACLLITGGELAALGEMAEEQEMLKLEGIPAAAGKEFAVEGGLT